MRKRDLQAEQKISERLLYQMIPKSIAEGLKQGKNVPPETSSLVTVYHSHIVNFPKMAEKSTPLRIVDMLNRLYG